LAFPCFDEPTYKAKFDVTLEVDRNLTALSYIPVTGATEKEGKKVVQFGTTPIMSTYLVAFAVGDFEYIEVRNTTNNVFSMATAEATVFRPSRMVVS